MDSVMVNLSALVRRLLLDYSVQVRTYIFEIKLQTNSKFAILWELQLLCKLSRRLYSIILLLISYFLTQQQSAKDLASFLIISLGSARKHPKLTW